MLGGDGPRLRMAWSLLFSLPGTPVMLYGDEIGMVEDLAREGRMSVRTPMQWSPPGCFTLSGGPLTAPSAERWDVVAEQERTSDSLLLRASPGPPAP